MASVEAEAEALLKKHANLIRRAGGKCGATTSGRLPLIEALFARNASAETISRILKAEGVNVPGETLRRHHRGICKCQN